MSGKGKKTGHTRHCTCPCHVALSAGWRGNAFGSLRLILVVGRFQNFLFTDNFEGECPKSERDCGHSLSVAPLLSAARNNATTRARLHMIAQCRHTVLYRGTRIKQPEKAYFRTNSDINVLLFK